MDKAPIKELAEEAFTVARERLKDPSLHAYHTHLAERLFERMDWPQWDLSKVLRREMWIGATLDYVYLMWGRPRRLEADHFRRQTVHWLFYDGVTVCVENGLVASWHVR